MENNNPISDSKDNKKSSIRKSILNIRNNMSPAEANSAGVIIVKKVFESQEYLKADIILTYYSCNNEVDTINIIEKAINDNKKVAIPKVINKGFMNFYYIDSIHDTSKGYMGILEPNDTSEEKMFHLNAAYGACNNILIICPGVAFDRQRNRIGYGAGFYDRYLEKCTLNSISKDKNNTINMKSIAIAYDFQVIDFIPAQIHDKCVDMIITEKNTY